MKFKLKSGDTLWAAKGLFIKGDLILIVKPTGSKDRYDIPGGKIKVGESKEQGVYRECFEELALKIKSAEFIGENNNRKKCYFKITKWSGKIILQTEELEKYRWVSIDEALEYNLTKTARHGIQMLLDTI